MNTTLENKGFPLDWLVVDKTPSAPAIAYGDRIISYEELNLRVGQLAAWLLEQGLVAGDRVATWLPKTMLACVMPLAAARAGLIHVPVNPALKAMQLQHIVEDSGARVLISKSARLNQVDVQALPSKVALWDEAAVWESAEKIADPCPPSSHNTDCEALAAILYTSGSTGKPKGVMLSHTNLTLGAISVADYLHLAADDRTLCVLPLSFDYGQNQLLSTWAAGGCAVPLDYLTPRDVIKACTKQQITTLAAVPPLWVQLVEQSWTQQAVSSMRRLTNSGGALTPRLVRELRGIFGARTDIVAMYGLTEAFRSTYLDPDLIDIMPTSIGRAIPFAEILVVDADGNAAMEGELVHAGPLVAKGYWQDPMRTAERFKPAPSHAQYQDMAVWSGDKVRVADDGNLYFIGREDQMIKSSGNRISPTEIEEAAISTGCATEALAFGISDERLGHRICLLVRLAEDADVPAVEAAMRKILPNFMQPHQVVAVREFPRNANGKLDRTAVIADYAPQRDAA